jgi:hypothetical protein
MDTGPEPALYCPAEEAIPIPDTIVLSGAPLLVKKVISNEDIQWPQ